MAEVAGGGKGLMPHRTRNARAIFQIFRFRRLSRLRPLAFKMSKNRLNAIAEFGLVGQRSGPEWTMNARPLFLLLTANLLQAATPMPAALSSEGWGVVHIGMTQRQVEQAIGYKLKVDYVDDEKSCGQTTDLRVKDTSLMFVDGKLARIEVNGPGLTIRGVGVGSTEKQVRAAFPKLTVEPHKYAPGEFYFKARASARTGVMFEANRKRLVTDFYLGSYPAVEYVEGCY